MADELAMIVGEIRGATEAINARLDRQDEQHERDKQAAIQARAENHAENKDAIEKLTIAMDNTAMLARDSKLWIDTKGKDLLTRVDNIHDRVTAIEGKAASDAAESRGQLRTWASVGAIGSGIAGLLGWLGWDTLKAFFAGHH